MNYQNPFKPGKLLFIRSRLLGYCCESGITIFAWRVVEIRVTDLFLKKSIFRKRLGGRYPGIPS